MPRRLAGLGCALAFAATVPLLCSPLALDARAATSVQRTSTQAPQAVSIPGLTLSVSPYIVDVGDNVLLTLTSKKWPGTISVSVSFLSAHHGFTGQMLWNGGCSCFRIAVSLARRIHSLEQARAVATVVYHQQRLTAATRFLIRGLAPDGKSFAAGGPETLTAWVSDPQPNPNEQEHICAWVKTLDGLGVPRIDVHFSLHFDKTTQSWNAGVTNADGIVCSYRRLPGSAARKTVRVDAYAASMHAVTQLTPLA